jgi:hypothetical protein
MLLFGLESLADGWEAVCYARLMLVVEQALGGHIVDGNKIVSQRTMQLDYPYNCQPRLSRSGISIECQIKMANQPTCSDVYYRRTVHVDWVKSDSCLHR